MQSLSERTAGFTDSVIRRMTRVSMQYGAVNLSQGFPDFEPPKEILDRMAQVAYEDFHQYSITWGSQNFREALAAKQSRCMGRRIDPNTEIVTTCGSTEAMMAAMMTVCNPGDKVAVFSPFYENYGADAILSGADPVYVPLVPPDFHYDSEALERAFQAGAKALILCNPSNPCGKVFTMEEMEEIAELAKRYDAFVITDEVYEYIIYGENRHISMAALPGMYERTITCSSLSKTYSMTGWRVGYAAGNAALIKGMTSLQGHTTSNTCSIAQYAALEAISGPQDSVESMRVEFDKRRKFLVERLNSMDGITCNNADGAFYLMPNMTAFYDKEWNGKKIADSFGMADYLLAEAKIAVVPGGAFESPDNIRIAYSNSMESLIEGMNRMEAALKKLG